MPDINFITTTLVGLFLAYGPKVLLAIITWFIGRIIIRNLLKLVEKIMDQREMDASLKPFLKSLLNALLFTALIITVASMVGIETTSFVAILGAAGLAIGLALQGSLSNFAGGVLILILKPFKVGDLIEVGGHLGHVQSILIFNTILTTLDNKTAILANGKIMNGDIINYSTLGKLRVDLVAGIGYGEDIKKAKEVIMKVMQDHPKVLKEPAPSVNVLELADSSVNFAVRPYSTTEDYWDVYFDITEGVKLALDANNIQIPFPQTDVHIIPQNGSQS